MLHSRSLSREGEDPAVFVSALQQHVWVEAERSNGERQIYDVNVAGAVDKMTVWLEINSSIEGNLMPLTHVSGQHIEISEDILKNRHTETTWMRASTRMTLGVLLHPDRMSTADWQDIAGIGPVLAQKITTWRQKNGDFVSISRLQQVKGVGPKTIASLRHWFLAQEQPVK
ncbi:MAG: helix-hairpin-helix domain-containing protein [Desulfuromonadaceae bacterium]|nr:helix-hairpin-helix domain-containing protein [Desulfuromonas sp.]MDY0184804.1 helix-hairpin-helix domain-containing protein [Desulfuromonadaceae bacterium]